MNTINPNDSKEALSKTPFKNFAIGVVVILIFLIGHSLFAQVGVGTTNPQSALDIQASNVANPANTDGILIPRIDNFPASNPTISQDGLLVFYTGTASMGKGFYYWDQPTTSWIFLSGAKKINNLLDGKSDDDGSQNGSSLFIGELAGLEDDGTDNRNVGIGYLSLAEGSNRINNTAVGYSSLATNDQGDSNTAIGYFSMLSNRFGNNNTALGTESLMLNNDGENNVGIGYRAGYGNLSGDNNTFIGALTGGTISVSGNVYIGHRAGSSSNISNTLFIENTNANASNALIYGEFGTDNTTTGNLLRTNGEFQIGNPSGTGYAFPTVDGIANQIMTTDGSGQINFVDVSTLFTDTDDQNIQNLSFNNSTNILTVGIENGTAQTVDLSALDDTGNDWSINGNSGTNPSTNFIGTTDNQDLAFRTNNVEKVRITAKGQIETTQLQSVWIGENAGNSVTSGTRNTFVGRISGASITTGNDNTAIGGLSLSSLSTGIDNTAIGLGALYDLQNGDGNTFVGEQSGENLATGSYNTVFGHLAGENMNGSSNIFIGHEAGRSTTGSNKLIIDNSNDGTSSFIYGEMDNEILRANAEVQVTRNSTGTISHLDLIETAANDGSRLRFSNSAETTNNWLLYGRADDTEADARFNLFFSSIAGGGGGNIIVVTGDGNVGIRRTPTTNELEVNGTASKATAGAWLANSDRRLKKNINTIDSEFALNKLLNLRGVTYEWNDNQTGTERPKELQYGFIAQELMEVFPEKVTKDNLGFYQTSYGDYDAVFVQAIKELNKKIESLETENTILKYKLSRLEALEARLLAVEKSMNNDNTNTSVSHTADE